MAGPGDFVLVSMDGEGEDAVRRRAGRVSRDSGEPALRERAHQYAIEHRHHVLVVTVSDAEFKELARRYRDGGYRVEVLLLAVPAALSKFGAAAGYLRSVKATGSGRLVSRRSHDLTYDGVRRGALAIDAGGVADQVVVVRGDGEQVYGNQVGPDGEWEGPVDATGALDKERARVRTPDEYQQFTETLTAELNQLALRQAWPWHKWLAARLLQTRWKRKLAQIRQQAADTIRPSSDMPPSTEIDAIFDTYVASLRDDATAGPAGGWSSSPGSPGRARSGSPGSWPPAWPGQVGRDFVYINTDAYSRLHPDYLRMLLEDGDNARLRIWPLTHELWDRAHRHVLGQRQNVLVEGEMASEADFEDLARQYRAARYRVEVFFLAVPAAMSRLATVTMMSTSQSPPVSRRSHDDGYDGVRRGALAIDAGGIADQVTVIRRDGVQVYRSQVGLDGQWEGGAGATQALDAERDRRRTFEEAQQFTDAFTAEHDRVAGLQPGWPGRGGRPRRRRLVAERFRARWGGVLNEVAQQAAVILPPAPSAVARDLDEAAEQGGRRDGEAGGGLAGVCGAAGQPARGRGGERSGPRRVALGAGAVLPVVPGAGRRTGPRPAGRRSAAAGTCGAGPAGADAVADGHAQLLSELALAAAARGPVTVSAVVGQWIYRMDRVQAEERIGAEGIAAYEQELGLAGRAGRGGPGAGRHGTAAAVRRSAVAGPGPAGGVAPGADRGQAVVRRRVVRGGRAPLAR